jgi:pyruvate dehydrogenase E1 component
MKALAEQLRGCIRAPYHVLGTDGFGRSDTRDELRHFFEVDRRFVALAALRVLAEQQKIPLEQVRAARDAFGIHPDKLNPRRV